jgi:hypothetical protein
MKGKTIRIFLMDGIPTGSLTAEIINWTGKIIVAPRAQLAGLAIRDEPKRTGVYCLIGPDPDSSIKDRVYIGEGDNVLKRLTSHDADEAKDYWTRVVLVISKDQNLTKAHVRYLESRLIQIAQKAGRASLANGTAPPTPQLPEPDVADMEFFLEQIQMIFPVLGFGFLLPKPVLPQSTVVELINPESPLFILSVKAASAKAREVAGEFIVMKGSTACRQDVKSWTSYRSLRDQLVQEGKLIDSGNPECFEFAEDVGFSSPSAAAAVVNAGNANGRRLWKVSNTSQTYQDWYDQKLEAAGVTSEEN